MIVPDKFYELTRKNEDMYLFSPYSVEKEYGIPFSYIDITKEYDNLVMNPNIRKQKSKLGTLKMKFRNCSKNLAILTSSILIPPIVPTQSMAKSL